MQPNIIISERYLQLNHFKVIAIPFNHIDFNQKVYHFNLSQPFLVHLDYIQLLFYLFFLLGLKFAQTLLEILYFSEVIEHPVHYLLHIVLMVLQDDLFLVKDSLDLVGVLF